MTNFQILFLIIMTVLFILLCLYFLRHAFDGFLPPVDK